MNICFLVLNFQEASGGATMGGTQRASSTLAKELRLRGHSVEFYSFAIPPLPRFLFPSLISLFPAFLTPLSRGARSAIANFHQFLKEHKIDVAVCQGGTWRIMFLLKNLPCPLVTMWHTVPFYSEQACADAIVKRLKLRSRLTQRLARSMPCCWLAWKFYKVTHSRFFSCALHHSDKFVLLSEEFFADFAPGEKFPGKVCAIPNIAPYVAQNISSDKKKELLFVGKMLMAVKQPQLLLHVWHKLENRFPNWSLRLVGAGDDLEEVKNLATSLGLKNVSFEGHQDPTPYYRSASILCMTSAYEGFGLVLVEAQAHGCVPIAFDSPGAFRDIIDDGINGFLVPPFDLDAYAGKLSELMLDPELRSRLASAAQESVSRFSPGVVGDRWEKLLTGGGRKEKELLFVGKMLMAVKQPHLLLQIWCKLQDRFPDWKLRLVGDGSDLTELQAFASSLRVKNVSFEGFQDPAPYYRSASIFCMTSAYEGFPNVLLEAQAFGCVPVAFESFGSVRDIIDDGVNGVIVHPFNVDVYAEKLAQLMSNHELRERLANNAQKSIAKFSSKAIGDKWEKLLREVVVAGSPRQ